MKTKLRVGQLIEVPHWKDLPGPNVGNVTQITKNKVRVLFPIHKYAWLPKHAVKVTR